MAVAVPCRNREKTCIWRSDYGDCTCSYPCHPTYAEIIREMDDSDLAILIYALTHKDSDWYDENKGDHVIYNLNDILSCDSVEKVLEVITKPN